MGRQLVVIVSGAGPGGSYIRRRASLGKAIGSDCGGVGPVGEVR